MLRPRVRRQHPRHRLVTEGLRDFFAELTAQLAAGAGEIWHKVERRARRKDTSAAEPPRPHIPESMQQQSLQQQQSKTDSEEQKETGAAA